MFATPLAHASTVVSVRWVQNGSVAFAPGFAVSAVGWSCALPTRKTEQRWTGAIEQGRPASGTTSHGGDVGRRHHDGSWRGTAAVAVSLYPNLPDDSWMTTLSTRMDQCPLPVVQHIPSPKRSITVRWYWPGSYSGTRADEPGRHTRPADTSVPSGPTTCHVVYS